MVHRGLNMSGGYQQHATLLFPLVSLLILDKKTIKKWQVVVMTFVSLLAFSAEDLCA